MYQVLLSFITAFISSYFIIPSIIKIAHDKHLCDEPGERRSHVQKTPSLGGVGIFMGVTFSILYWTSSKNFDELQYLLCAFIIIFLVGIKDDIYPITALNKLMGQLIAVCIVVINSHIRITNAQGFLGFTNISEWFSILLTIFTIIVIMNSFNLIDGIDGLSASIATIVSTFLGAWFLLIDHIDYSIIAFSLSGALVAFLRYNFTPAKIFMGDTGALFIGLVLSILIIQFIECNEELIGKTPYTLSSSPAIAFGVLILPLFDTLRVFVIRILRGRSPFSADRLHIHHLLLDLGFSHIKATGLLSLLTILFTILVLILQNLGTFQLITLVLALAWTLSFLLQYFAERHKLRLVH